MEWSGDSLFLLLCVCVFLFFLLCVVAIAWCQYKVFVNEMKDINRLTMEIIKDSTASVVLTILATTALRASRLRLQGG